MKANRYQTFRTVLTCGCAVLSRTPPRVPGSKFICTSGQAHGYSLGWTRWEDRSTDQVTINPLTLLETAS